MSDSTNESEVQAIMAEQRSAQLVKDLDVQNAPVFERIQTAAQTAQAAAMEQIENAEEYAIVRRCATSIKTAQSEYEAKAKEIDADPRGYGVQWRTDEKSKLLEQRDAEVARAKEKAFEYVGKLASRFPEQSWSSPTPDVTAEAQLIIGRFPMMAAGGFMREVSDVIRRASDPATPAATRDRLNLLLAHAYAPLCERRAEAPEHHARGLAGAAEKLSTAIGAHLSTVLGRSTYQTAQEIAARTTQAFNNIEATLKASGQPKGNMHDTAAHFDLIEMSHPDLFPDSKGWWNGNTVTLKDSAA